MKMRGGKYLAGVIIMALALLPCLAVAGSIEPPVSAVDPSGNPVPTMKTLDEIPPAWSQKLRADDGEPDGCNSSRFKCVLDGKAVLDKETGLVWERSPWNYEGDWWTAQWQCWASSTGQRSGWRLPTASEIDSLREFCAETWRFLPCGHPFINLQGGSYWSTTTWFWDSNEAIAFRWDVGYQVLSKSVSTYRYNWCVRGGTGSHYESD